MNGAATETNHAKKKTVSFAAPQPETKSPSQIVAGFFYAFFHPFCDALRRSKKSEARGKIS